MHEKEAVFKNRVKRETSDGLYFKALFWVVQIHC